MAYWFYVLSLVLVIQNPNVNASDSDVSINSYVGGDECKSCHKKSNGSSDTRSFTASPEEEAVSDPEFEKLIHLSPEALNSISEKKIMVLAVSTLENLYWERSNKHLREDPAKVAALCRIAAIGNYLPALGEYGNILYAGRGVLQNQREALTWYLKSAQAGDEETITFLDRLLREETLFDDFKVTEVSEHAKIRSIIEEAYSKLQSHWEN